MTNITRRNFVNGALMALGSGLLPNLEQQAMADSLVFEAVMMAPIRQRTVEPLVSHGLGASPNLLARTMIWWWSAQD